jgi:hypothetical protein
MWLAVALVALAAALSLGPGVVAQGPPPSLPLPEMQRLSKFYVGTWNFTETYPTGATNTGVYTSELGPGGNSIINRFRSKGPSGDVEGVLVMTWDPAAKAYKSYVLTSDSPGALIQTGQWEGESLVFRGEMTMGSSKIALRNTTMLRPDGTLVSEQASSRNGGPETLVVRVEAVRK